MIGALAVFGANHEHIVALAIFGEVASGCECVEHGESLFAHHHALWRFHFTHHVHGEVDHFHTHERIFHLFAHAVFDYGCQFVGADACGFDFAQHRYLNHTVVVHDVGLQAW